LRVQATRTRAGFDVTCDGDGVVAHTGAALLGELADRLGLTAALGWRADRRRTGRRRHATGRVLRDLAVMLADGGDCLSDLAVLRDQPELFGPVASTATAWRVVERVAADELGLAGLRAARAQARERSWRVGAWPEVDLLLVDVDGTLLDAHSDKQGAAGTYKRGFGFYPLLAFLDRPDGTGEALAGLLRPGNAGSNTAADHIEVMGLAARQRRANSVQPGGLGGTRGNQGPGAQLEGRLRHPPPHGHGEDQGPGRAPPPPRGAALIVTSRQDKGARSCTTGLPLRARG